MGDQFIQSRPGVPLRLAKYKVGDVIRFKLLNGFVRIGPIRLATSSTSWFYWVGDNCVAEVSVMGKASDRNWHEEYI